MNEGPTVEARVEGWKESRGSADECINFLERKSRLKFKKVRLIIQVFFPSPLHHPSSAASFCGYIGFLLRTHPTWRWCFLYYYAACLAARRVSEMVWGLWTSGDFLDITKESSLRGHHGHTVSNTKYPTLEKPKSQKKAFKSRLVRNPRSKEDPT